MTLGSARWRIDARLVQVCDSERILVQRLVQDCGCCEVFGRTRPPFPWSRRNYWIAYQRELLRGLGTQFDQFDPFLVQHIEQQGARGRGEVSIFPRLYATSSL